ncbi:MAG: bifunctional hydroxymethylpyrimidine kinase/phosphomethylpyrimidine kinase [Rhodobacteraceae bacterium]|nr:MAG: bifunctional hydroxymethylpyrimidine kinase/phosphomethylpyrimidine kinase [Paracoccaceae bacterium]
MTAIALTIAGSDSGGGAGIQADLKTFSALGVYGASVITAITAQNTQSVTAIQGIDTDVIAAQIEAVLSDLDVRAVKIGMLSSPEIIQTVASGLKDFKGAIVLDPVMVAKSGDSLLQDSAVDSLVRDLIPMASLLTPNLPEAARLLNGRSATNQDQMLAQGHALRALGCKAVLMKGGHGSDDICTDILVGADQSTTFSAPRIATKNTHGTGCTLSSAITAGLAKGLELSAATAQAHDYLQGAIKAADGLNIGHGHGPVHHFYRVWSA